MDPQKTIFSYGVYVKTSDFQVEYHDIEEFGSDANFGQTCKFKIDKVASMLGKVDLIIDFNACEPVGSEEATGNSPTVAWCEAIGFAMIKKAQLWIGNKGLVEELSGEHMYIMNELLRDPDKRLVTKLGYTGRSMVETVSGAVGVGGFATTTTKYNAFSRYIREDGVPSARAGEQKLYIPLEFFFTKNPSHYLPLAGIAHCNDIEIRIEFRQLSEVITKHVDPTFDTTTGLLGAASVPSGPVADPRWSLNKPFDAKLRCEYIHLSSMEEDSHQGKEHVRLVKEWISNYEEMPRTLSFYPATAPSGSINRIVIDLNFLHQVSEIVLVIRKLADISRNSTVDVDQKYSESLPVEGMGGLTKNRFAFHGRGKDPNPESIGNRIKDWPGKGNGTKLGSIDTWITVKNVDIKLNNQSRHPNLTNGIDADYLFERVMPRLYSATSAGFEMTSNNSQFDNTSIDHNDDFKAIAALRERKAIFVYPFSIIPDSHNPAGHVNFDKVSKGTMELELECIGEGFTGERKEDYVIDIWGLTYNWVQIVDGAASRVFH